ncbi:hypothetical protein KQI18_07295 [Clostridioides mangenotii]|uniref:hypothetical protein n=1 Tax=Metaclostridioides mangenotii TaxID=1540 RepID=UPI001C114A05|nr:hypothetical protein [Clostridioides mangenotii]MBU5307588.1 hypothetical protein [Clostridioides mangenotii]
MNNLLFLIGIIFLSNGNISLLDYIDKFKKNIGLKANKVSKERVKRMPNDGKIKFKFNANDISKGLKLMELSDEDLDMGMELITRTKKYMSREERKILIQIESILDLVSGIKKLNSIETIDMDTETDFFRNMDDEDKKNMMIKEILEVFPQKKKGSVKKALDMKKKIDVFAELFLPDDFGEGGFSLSSLADIGNLGSMNNLMMLGNLLRSEPSNKKENTKEKKYHRSSVVENEDFDISDYENENYYFEDDNYDNNVEHESEIDDDFEDDDFDFEDDDFDYESDEYDYDS